MGKGKSKKRKVSHSIDVYVSALCSLGETGIQNDGSSHIPAEMLIHGALIDEAISESTTSMSVAAAAAAAPTTVASALAMETESISIVSMLPSSFQASGSTVTMETEAVLTTAVELDRAVLASMLARMEHHRSDDYSFLQLIDIANLAATSGNRDQNSILLTRILVTSLGSFLSRNLLYIHGEHREGGMPMIITCFHNLIDNNTFTNDGLEIDQLIKLKTIIQILLNDGHLFRQECTKRFAKIDRDIRTIIRRIMKELNIGPSTISPKTKFWLWDCDANAISSMNLSFSCLQASNVHSLFPLIALVVAFYCSPSTALSDRFKLTKAISKILNGEGIKRTTVWKLVSETFMSICAAVIELLCEKSKLPTGPATANSSSQSVVGRASQISRYWIENEQKYPEMLQKIENPTLEKCIVGLMTKKEKKEKKEKNSQIQILKNIEYISIHELD